MFVFADKMFQDLNFRQRQIIVQFKEVTVIFIVSIIDSKVFSFKNTDLPIRFLCHPGNEKRNRTKCL